MKDSILLDPEHGVNPSLEQCFVCGEDKGLILFGRLSPAQRKAFHEAGLHGDSPGAAPRKVCLSKEPCDKCKEHMKQGVILISVDECRSDDSQNPYRTGGFVVVKEDAIRRLIQPPDLADKICTARLAFVPDDAWNALGLPRA